LKDEDPGVRGSAAEALGEIGDPRAVGPLINALKDKSLGVRAWGVRVAATEALGKIGDPRAIEFLKELLTEKDSYSVGKEAQKALDEIRKKRQ
jgi:HEAT repeat protein